MSGRGQQFETASDYEARIRELEVANGEAMGLAAKLLKERDEAVEWLQALTVVHEDLPEGIGAFLARIRSKP